MKSKKVNKVKEGQTTFGPLPEVKGKEAQEIIIDEMSEPTVLPAIPEDGMTHEQLMDYWNKNVTCPVCSVGWDDCHACHGTGRIPIEDYYAGKYK